MAIEWENNGSYEDLSNLAKNSITAGSMSATNTVSDESAAQSAPGSTSESTDGVKQGDPSLDVPAAEMPPGTDGKPRTTAGEPPKSRPGWGYVKGGRNA